MNLKEALKKNKLKQFIKERSGQKGDRDKFDRTIGSMVGKSKAAPATSLKGSSANYTDTQTPKRTLKGAAAKRERESRE